MRKGSRSLFVLAVLALIACAAPVVSLAPATHSFTADDYERVYERWTREARPFDFGRMEDVLNVTASFESREFRWAYVVRYARDFGLGAEARNTMLAATLSDAEQHHRFFVTLGGNHKPREWDLTDERGAWRVLLMDDRGRQVRPIEITKIRRPTPAERRYFPSGTAFPPAAHFRTAFRLVFPVKHEDGYPTIPNEAMFAVLRFTGPEGQVDLKWEFAHP